jgi:hypothetical protein
MFNYKTSKLIIGIICGILLVSPVESKNQTDSLRNKQVQQNKDGFVFYIDFTAMTGGAITVDNIRELLGGTGKFYLSKRDLERVQEIVRKGRDTRITNAVFSQLSVRLLVENSERNTLIAVDNHGVVQMGNDIFSLTPVAFLELSRIMEYKEETLESSDSLGNAVNSKSSAIMVAKGFLKDRKTLRFLIEKGKYLVTKKEGKWLVDCDDGKNRIHMEIIARNGRLSDIYDANVNDRINKSLRP